jgi:hypothetical protein
VRHQPCCHARHQRQDIVAGREVILRHTAVHQDTGVTFRPLSACVSDLMQHRSPTSAGSQSHCSTCTVHMPSRSQTEGQARQQQNMCMSSYLQRHLQKHPAAATRTCSSAAAAGKGLSVSARKEPSTGPCLVPRSDAKQHLRAVRSWGSAASGAWTAQK